jgi:arginine deiminase
MEKYEYVEEWKPTNENEGVLKVLEKTPAKGQSKNNVRSIEYDCTIEDLKAGLVNLEKTKDKTMEQFDMHNAKLKNLKQELEAKGYVTEITEEMKKVLTTLDNAKLIDEIKSVEETIDLINEQLSQDFAKIEARNKIIPRK